jgi:hypothetical protein
MGWLACVGLAWSQEQLVAILPGARTVGAFEVAWAGDASGGSLRSRRGEQTVSASPPEQQAFLVAARGDESVRQTGHSYRICDRVKDVSER